MSQKKRFYVTGQLGGPYKVVDRDMAGGSMEGYGIFRSARFSFCRDAAGTMNKMDKTARLLDRGKS